MFGAEDIRDGFDKAHIGLLCWVPEGVAGRMFSCWLASAPKGQQNTISHQIMF